MCPMRFIRIGTTVFMLPLPKDSSNYFKNTITMEKGWPELGVGCRDMGNSYFPGYVYRKGVYEAVRLLNSEPTSYHYVL